MSKLTPKQDRFCLEYVTDLNATQAAIRAGYSVTTANRIASQNLSKLVIQERIAALQSDISTKHELTRDWLILELKANHRKAQELNRLNDSNKALELLGKMIGAYSDRLQLHEDVTINVTLIED